MDFLPVFLNIRGKKCLVVGGGEVALRKATLLCRAQAQLWIVAEEVSAELLLLCKAHNAIVHLEAFSKAHLSGCALIIAATDDSLTNSAVFDAANELGVPVNVVDQPKLCTFIMPAVVDKSPVVIAISSGGVSPVLSRQLKELVEVMLPQRIGQFAQILGSYRSKAKTAIPQFSQRLRFWEDVLESEIPELIYSGNEQAATALIESRMHSSKHPTPGGEVYLVGAGPGDPDLLTLRALRLMYKADVVLYDRLVSEAVMLKLRPDAQRIHVGKRKSDHTVPQETINDMLVRLAREGKRVLRLKGGDPFIFGRGGEELETLAESGIPFQVVPGITAASGCAAYAGIPLTHRDHAQSVRFLTGHLKEGELDLDWDLLVKEQQTLVFYMGLSGLPTICEKLLSHGIDPAMPMAIIEQGTTKEQKVFTAAVSTMVELAQSESIKAPTIIIIGRVVELRQKLSWYRS